MEKRNIAYPLFSTLIEQAIELSAQWHDQTYRKKRWRDAPFEVPPDVILRVPVMAHVAAVAIIVQRAGWEESVVAAAFLHDVLEDENRFGKRLRAEQLRETLGEEVLGYVQEVTEQLFDENNRKRRWRDRKESYIRRIREGSPQAAAISLADKLHNLWSINQGLALGVDVFASDEQGRAISGDFDAQAWFHEAVLAATEEKEDARLEPMRERLREEVDVFRGKAARRISGE